ncbi:DUF559 domain-containing protein [Gordonia sp. CNJ-863]|uniref:endonuclease domain-containing protein n=1 Tax=Gordonia sp. CNJ-863 TaxID=1904963 RepID=UPI0026B2D5B7|nr:DUF559 domain-containing protein [Gordonia sp. CNJ-863]
MGKMLVLVGSGARSAAERLAVDVFEEHRITGWVANHPAAGYVIDFAFLAEKVAVEIDGMAYHRDTEVFQSDRTRRNVLITAGWTVLNFTWADLLEKRGTLRRRSNTLYAKHRVRDECWNPALIPHSGREREPRAPDPSR